MQHSAVAEQAQMPVHIVAAILDSADVARGGRLRVLATAASTAPSVAKDVDVPAAAVDSPVGTNADIPVRQEPISVC
jgi:hypothetical protein